jgi:hypothetical protein
LTLTDPAVESTHDVVVQAYVQTHGHMLAHTVIRADAIRPCALLSLAHLGLGRLEGHRS